MKFQLVIQFPEALFEDIDSIAEIEEILAESLIPDFFTIINPLH